MQEKIARMPGGGGAEPVDFMLRLAFHLLILDVFPVSDLSSSLLPVCEFLIQISLAGNA